uniref:Ryanodine receptor Ryr domain-containing protein n=1 Tax=Caulobacter phage BL57 TaxID=3348355 RepID=A0AB74UNG5_9VIRU
MSVSAEVDRLVLHAAASQAAVEAQAKGDEIRATTITRIMEVDTVQDGPWWRFKRRAPTPDEAEKIRQNTYRWWDHAPTYWERSRWLQGVAENARCSELKAIRIEEDLIGFLRPFLGYQADE